MEHSSMTLLILRTGMKIYKLEYFHYLLISQTGMEKIDHWTLLVIDYKLSRLIEKKKLTPQSSRADMELN